ncbi:unnamed protein product [Callosobruchus maculatus]|uniref:Odorant receptor n=1 Tax=Callosobruchus maculatus TaxID=64391 RepID=A0A653DLC5_CALMS|nr:unnamed protein product [Callosobruchus maculatus]
MHFFNIKYTLILLNIIGSHPGKVGSKFQTFLYYSLFLCVVFVVSLSAINMFTNNITAVEVATTLAAFFVIFHHLTRLKNIFYLFCVTLTTWTMLTVSLSKLPFECYVPKWMPLRSLIILEDVVCVAVCLVLHCTNMLFMTIVTLLALQVRMLSDNFGNIFELEDCDEMTRIELKEWIQHHCFLLKYVDTVNEAFSRGMLVYLGNVVGFLCSYIFILSISDISDFGSVIPIVNVILPGSQKRVAVTAGSFGELSLETCMKVLNTVVSYYMFLKTMIDA